MITFKVLLPSVFNIFVDAGSDSHGHDSIIPGTDEHESKTQAHSQEGKSPVGGNTHFNQVFLIHTHPFTEQLLLRFLHIHDNILTK